MDKPTIVISSDYAVLSCDFGEFYYGYERTTDDDEWCFAASINGKETVIPFSELGAKDPFECVECLLMGIGIILDSREMKE